jgi:hypothetical protein
LTFNRLSFSSASNLVNYGVYSKHFSFFVTYEWEDKPKCLPSLASISNLVL